MLTSTLPATCHQAKSFAWRCRSCAAVCQVSVLLLVPVLWCSEPIRPRVHYGTPQGFILYSFWTVRVFHLIVWSDSGMRFRAKVCNATLGGRLPNCVLRRPVSNNSQM